MNKPNIQISGHSDDIVQVVGGGFREEFYPEDSKPFYLAFSDGTLLKARYDEDGTWRLTPTVKGTAEFVKTEATSEDDGSDIVSLLGDIRWVLGGLAFVATSNNQSEGETPEVTP